MSRIPFIIYLISHILFKYNIPIIPTFFMYLNRIIWGAYIPPSCDIGSKTKFGYGGSGVVLHARSKIGKNCIINPGVTVGGRSKEYKVPVIGNNVYIGGGVKILGPIILGNNIVIGANSVVMHDIPDNCVVVGIPAKIIKREIKVEDYV